MVGFNDINKINNFHLPGYIESACLYLAVHIHIPATNPSAMLCSND